MRLINRFIILIIVPACLSCASGSKSDSRVLITQLSGKNEIPYGSLVYGLPLTVVDVSVNAERVIEKPGPYARYAESLLGLRDVILNEREYWLIRSITVKTHEEPDPDAFYVIEAGSVFQTNALILKKTGLILDLNPQFFNSENGIIPASNDSSPLRISDLGADEYFQTRKDTAFKLVNVDTAFIKIPYLVEKRQRLSLEDLAGKAAVRLMEMRDGKHLILTGEANVFPQDEASINEINRIEKEYTELFTGKIWKEKRTFNYQIIPRKDQAGKPVTICNFSDTRGPSAEPADPGTPVIIEFLPQANSKGLSVITSRQSESSAPRFDKLYYRVPDVVNLKISFGNKVLETSRRLIYQFGEVIQLPSNYIIGK